MVFPDSFSSIGYFLGQLGHFLNHWVITWICCLCISSVEHTAIQESLHGAHTWPQDFIGVWVLGVLLTTIAATRCTVARVKTIRTGQISEMCLFSPTWGKARWGLWRAFLPISVSPSYLSFSLPPTPCANREILFLNNTLKFICNRFEFKTQCR